MTFTVAELQLLDEALRMASSRHSSYARDYGVGKAHLKHADKADRMERLRDKLASVRARHDVIEVAPQ